MRTEAVLLLILGAIACGGGEPEEQVIERAVPPRDNPSVAVEGPARSNQVVIDTAAAAGERPMLRETYTWQSGGSDPFRPMVTITASGPELPDLELSSLLYNSNDPSRSVAMFREKGSNRIHTVNPGQTIGGRLIVASIGRSSATLRMNDFGTIREQTYTLRRPGEVQ